MKSEYFTKRSQSSQLRGRREKPKPKQINWDRIVYFVLLIVGLGILFYYIFMSTFYVSGEGLVVTENLKVLAPSDIEIREQLVSNESFVERGDPIFRYSFLNWTGTVDEIEDIEEDIADASEEIQDLEDEITIKRQSLQEIQDRITYLEQQREDFLEKVRLNAATSYELTEVESSLFTARSNLRQEQSELNVLMNKRSRQIQARESLSAEIQELQSGENLIQTYYSPVTGIINNISVRSNQQAFRSDQIMSIKPRNADVYIFSVFDREDAEFAQPGTVMNIEFDNGAESVGVIRSSYDARENLIEHFEQTGTLTTEYVVVELAPVDSVTRAQWVQLDRSGLSVFRRKIGKGEVGISETSYSAQIRTNDGAEDQQFQSEQDSISTQSEEDTVSKPPANSGTEPVDTLNSSADEETAMDKLDGTDELYGLMGDSFNNQLDGYTINLYSLEDQEKASEISDNIRAEGLRVDVNSVTIDQRNLWRVAVGQFRTVDEAMKAAETIPASIADEYFIHRIQ
ncbi:MAG: SPOR domain-containing protein [Balneolaceae bacterium]|nr:SPOR domain-containing protein [Balneolaceae bacterium]MDR9407600.1 SPOR domain-containing protein [Balneolaceae bacterium]